MPAELSVSLPVSEIDALLTATKKLIPASSLICFGFVGEQGSRKSMPDSILPSGSAAPAHGWEVRVAKSPLGSDRG